LDGEGSCFAVPDAEDLGEEAERFVFLSDMGLDGVIGTSRPLRRRIRLRRWLKEIAASVAAADGSDQGTDEVGVDIE